MTESANLTSLTPNCIIDSTGALWGLVASGSKGYQVTHNGNIQTSTSNVVFLLYDNHLVYQQNTIGSWYVYQGTSWVATTDPRIAPAPTITGVTLSNATFTGSAPSATVVGTVAVTMSSGAFTGSLSVTGANASSFMMSGNNLETMGVVPAGSYSINIVATQSGATGSPFTVAETLTGTPVVVAPSITGITLSNSSFAGGAASGTVVGTVAVAMSSGTFTGSLSLTGANASSFQLVGNSLETNGVVAAGSYVVDVVATEASATGSPFTQAFSITATGSTGSWWTTPPPQAAAAGFNTLKFSDDFTSASTITMTNSETQRNFNWYPASWGGNMTSANIQVNPTWHAGDSNMTAQGVSSAGPDASPNGGIVRLQGGASNATIISVDGWMQTMPTSGLFQHYYTECYIQYQPSNITTNSQTVGWPGWWSWSMENMRGLGFGGSPFSGGYTEIDFWEYANFTNGHWGGAALHGSMSGGTGTGGVVIDSNWHTIGCLWTPTAVTFWYDNVQMGGSFTPSATLQNNHQFIMLGSGVIVTPQNSTQPCPIYVDWVRCWTAN